MKRFLIFILLLCLITTPISGLPQQKPILGTQINWGTTDGLVGFWLMNEGSGNKVYDLSGNGHTGTFQTNIIWQSGKFGSGLYFDGSSDRIDTDSNFNITTGLTLLAWIRTSGTSDTYPRIINSEGDWGMLMHSNTGELHFYGSGIDTTFVSDANPDMRDGIWHQVVITYDGDGIEGYVDNIHVGTIAKTGSLTAATTVTIGGRTAGNRSLLGNIDNAAIWNRALSASEINKLYSDPFYMLRPSFNLFLFGGLPVSAASQVIFIKM